MIGNLDPLLAGIKRLANQGILLPVQSPPSIVLNAATGLSLVYNPATGQHDLTCTVQGVATSAGGQWTTALDLDFTTQAPQTFTADGNYTIGGLTWKKENSAVETAHAAISAAGLNFQPGPGSYYNGGPVSDSRTLPLLWLPLSSIMSIDWDTSVRVWAYVSADNTTALGYGGACFGLDDDGSGAGGNNNGNGYAIIRGYGGTQWVGESICCWAMINSDSQTSTVRVETPSMTLGDPNRVVVLQTAHLGDFQARAMFASNATIWPATSVLRAASFFVPANANIGAGPSQLAPTTMGIFLGGCGFGSGSAFSCTYARIRVDYKQG